MDWNGLRLPVQLGLSTSWEGKLEIRMDELPRLCLIKLQSGSSRSFATFILILMCPIINLQEFSKDNCAVLE